MLNRGGYGGAFSIWHWLVVIILFFVPIVSVATEKSNITTGRANLAVWVFVYCIGGPIIVNFLGGMFIEHIYTLIIIFLYWIVITFLLYRKFVHRARDAGISKRIAYLAIIPLINFVAIGILLFKRGSNSS